MSRALIFVSSLTALCSIALGACPAGWMASKAIADKCYFFSRDNATMAEAQEFCEMLGRRYTRVGSLVTVESAAVQAELAAVMNSTGSKAYWIGLQDIVQEGTFEWINRGKPVTYVNWGPVQPNNRFGSENCVVLRYEPKDNFIYQWTDDPCDDVSEFICEMTGQLATGSVIG